MNELLVILPSSVYVVLGITQVLVHRRRRLYVKDFAFKMGAKSDVADPEQPKDIGWLAGKFHSANSSDPATSYLLSQNRFLVTLSILLSMVIAFIFTIIAMHAAGILRPSLQSTSFIEQCLGDQSLLVSISMQPSVAYSIIGAYVWGVYEFVSMIRNKDWSVTSQHFIWLRMPIACTLCQLLESQLGSGDVNYLIAFGLGALPVESIYRYVRRASLKSIGGASDIETSGEQWREIDGVTQFVLDRLHRHEIETPTHLAYQEPFSLYARSNIEWRLLLDLMDQSLLATYLPGMLPTLRKNGIRGTIDLAATYLNAQQGDPACMKQLEVLSQILGFATVDQLRSIARNISEDSQTHSLWTMWNKVQVPSGVWSPPNIS